VLRVGGGGCPTVVEMRDVMVEDYCGGKNLSVVGRTRLITNPNTLEARNLTQKQVTLSFIFPRPRLLSLSSMSCSLQVDHSRQIPKFESSLQRLYSLPASIRGVHQTLPRCVASRSTAMDLERLLLKPSLDSMGNSFLVHAYTTVVVHTFVVLFAHLVHACLVCYLPLRNTDPHEKV
jgi:hypothetical protein